jgi:hypothetical protein
MSHIVTLRTRVKDPEALAQACQRLGFAPPTTGTTRLYAGQATGLIIALPDWTYPVVFDVVTGAAQYDNFGGAWGDPRELDRLLQAYAVEKIRIEARRRGQTLTEQPLPGGSVKLIVHAGS